MPDRIVGLSVKQSQDATKTNYSIHKLLPLTVAEELTQIKRDFLIAKGFSEHDKTKRNEVNQLFYPETPERPTNPSDLFKVFLCRLRHLVPRLTLMI
jgi:hypothetical protein